MNYCSVVSLMATTRVTLSCQEETIGDNVDYISSGTNCLMGVAVNIEFIGWDTCATTDGKTWLLHDFLVDYARMPQSYSVSHVTQSKWKVCPIYIRMSSVLTKSLPNQ